MDHNPRTLILSRTAVIAGLAVAFALVLSTALLSSFAARDLTRTDRLGSMAKEAVSATTQLLASVAAAESVLNHAAGSRMAESAPGETARARLREEVLALGVHFNHRADLRPYLQQLEELSRSPGDAGVQLATPPNAAAAHTASLASRYAEMRRLLYSLQRQEFAALVEYSAAAADRARRIQSLNAALILLAMGLAAAGAWLLFRRIREVENLITVCAWTRRVKWQGRWISFEEYLAKRFNLRCTHGISDEAAAQMCHEVENTEIPADLRRGEAATAVTPSREISHPAFLQRDKVLGDPVRQRTPPSFPG